MFRIIFIAICYFNLSPLMANNILLPDLGNPEKRVFAPNEARNIGIGIEGRLRQQGHLLEQPEVTQYIRQLGHSLAAYAPTLAQYHFFVIDSPSINAFATPGGFIGINSGLINAVDNEDQLAAVLAHEIGHVSLRHIARSIARAQDYKWVNAIGILAAAIVGVSTESVEAMSAIASGSQAYVVERQLEYSRTHEKQADDVSREILKKAGYDPDQLGVFLGKLAISMQVPEFLLSHPLPENRIVSKSVLDTGVSESLAPELPLDFQLAKVATAFYARGGNEVSIKLSASAQAYQSALRQLRQGGANVLAQTLSNLPAKAHPSYAALQAQVAIAKRDYTTAQAVLAAAWQRWPNDERIALSYARVLFVQRHYQKAQDILQTMIGRLPTSVIYYDLLGEVYAQEGKQTEQFILAAKYYALIGDYELAHAQVEIALSYTDISLNNRQRLLSLKKQYEKLIEN